MQSEHQLLALNIAFRKAMTKRTLTFLLLMSSLLVWGQDRYQSGELKGFTISRGEHIIDHLDEAITVREVKGAATIALQDNSPLEGVQFELRGPGESGTIRSIKTDASGRFFLKNIHSGKYLFKATSLGFQSVVGVLIVSPQALREQTILLRMKPGV
jgi:hypothetical protein